MSATAESFGRDRRIRSALDFQAIYRDRRSIRNRTLTFCWRLRPTAAAGTRIGLSVGRRIGNAVERNRVKRVLREVFRREGEAFSQALDIIVIPRDFRTASNYDEMLSSFRHLQRKLAKEVGTAEPA